MAAPAFRFYHDQLPDDRQRAFYDAVESAVCERKDMVVLPSIPGMSEENYMRILEHVYDDHPEFFSFFPLQSNVILNGATVRVVFFYRYSTEEQARYEAELDRAVQGILDQCFPRGWEAVSEIRREKAIFDWITANVVYDQKSIDLLNTRKLTPVARSVAWNAYGALVQRTAVCEGIACAFKLLCDQVRIPSIVALGNASGGRHAWNLVRVNRKFYQVDCTWDLRSNISTQVPFARYRYFNLPDRIIGVTHKAESQFLPVCGSLQYNPFRIRNLCAAKPEEVGEIAVRMADEGQDRFAVMTVGFKASDVVEAASNRLSKHVRGNVTWYTDDSGYFAGFVITKRGVGRRK